MYPAVVEAIALLLGAFGASGALWTWQNRARLRDESRRRKAMSEMLDDDMQVAFALAKHEAETRKQPLAPLHLLGALVQAEPIVAAIEKLGGTPAALEAAIEDALTRLDPASDPRFTKQLLGSGLGHAQHHARKMTCTDALALLVRAGHGAVLDVAPVSAHALFFTLVHGTTQPPTTLAGETAVHVVIRNDDFSTHDFVSELLRRVFDLSDADALAKTRTTHETGRAIVGRFAAELAREKLEAARARARAAAHAALDRRRGLLGRSGGR